MSKTAPYNSDKKKRGAAALVTVLMIGGVIIDIAIIGLLVVFFLTQSGIGVKLSSEALAASQAGIQDGIIKVLRNQYTAATWYTLDVGTRSAQIIICQDTYSLSTPCDTTYNPGVIVSGQHKIEITSIGSALLKRRKLKAFLNVGINTAEMQIESIKEQPL